MVCSHPMCSLHVRVYMSHSMNILHVFQFHITTIPMLMHIGLLQEVPELHMKRSASSSYHFLHKTVQEFMAALHVSLLPPGERAEFIETSFGKSNMTMVVRFMAGLTKFQSQDDIQGVRAFQEEGGRKLLESLHWLFEAHDTDLVQKCMGHRDWDFELYFSHFIPYDCYVFGYCIANSSRPWNLRLHGCSINGECMEMLMLVENKRAFDYIKSFDFAVNRELGRTSVLGTLNCMCFDNRL